MTRDIAHQQIQPSLIYLMQRARLHSTRKGPSFLMTKLANLSTPNRCVHNTVWLMKAIQANWVKTIPLTRMSDILFSQLLQAFEEDASIRSHARSKMGQPARRVKEDTRANICWIVRHLWSLKPQSDNTHITIGMSASPVLSLH